MNYNYFSADSSHQSPVGQASTSPFVLVDNMEYSTSLSETTTPLTGSTNNPNHYVSSILSNHFYNDNTNFGAHKINKLLSCNLQSCVVHVSESIAGYIFPDTNFGFPINDQFLLNFRGSFLSDGCTINHTNFVSKSSMSFFLNQMVSTIFQFLCATKQTSLKPLHYFSAQNATQPVDSHPIKWMPDITLLCLIDGCTQDGHIKWHDIHAMIEHTGKRSSQNKCLIQYWLKAS